MKKLSSAVSVIIVIFFISSFCVSCSPISMVAIGADVGLKLMNPSSSSSSTQKEVTGSRHWDPGKKKYYYRDERGKRVY